MHIDCIEIRNYRRLIATHIDMSENTTLLVGANNSGKTSAIAALRNFLRQRSFSVYDIPLSLWGRIDALGDLFASSEDPEAWRGPAGCIGRPAPREPNRVSSRHAPPQPTTSARRRPGRAAGKCLPVPVASPVEDPAGFPLPSPNPGPLFRPP